MSTFAPNKVGNSVLWFRSNQPELSQFCDCRGNTRKHGKYTKYISQRISLIDVVGAFTEGIALLFT